MRLTQIAIALLLAVPAVLAITPAAAAYQPPPQCIREPCCFAPCEPFHVEVCIEGVNADACYPQDVCVSASRMVPVCADVPCYGPVDCFACGDDIAWACNVDPCSSRYFACTPPPPTSAAPPELVCTEVCSPCGTLIYCGPLVGACVDDVTHDGCYGGNWICVGFSYQVPQCVRHIEIVCTEICNPCTFVQCDIDVAQSRPTEPMCMYYYWELDAGAVRYVQRDSCHSELYVNGERVK